MTFTTSTGSRDADGPEQPATVTGAVGSLHKAMTGLMVATALAPLAAFTRKIPDPVSPLPSATGRRLGGVVARLQEASAAAADGARRGVVPGMRRGSRYLDRTHRCAAGSRRYKLYLPASRLTRPGGLIVMLHGCNQTPDDFAIGTHMNALAEKHGLAIAYPAQSRRRNAAGCWNWFRPAHQVRGMGEPAILASLTRKLMCELGLDRNAVFVAGLSSGGAMAAILADVYPDVFSAAGVHSGMARGAAHNAISAMSAMRSGASGDGATRQAMRRCPVRWIIFQGADDSTVHPSNAAMILAATVGDDAMPSRISNRSAKGRDYARSDYAGPDGTTRVENWMIESSGHAWSGGRAGGSYTDPKGPDASAQMIRFFLAKSA